VTTVTLSGFKELEAALEQMSKAVGKGVLRRAGIKALRPVAKVASGMAPDDPATSAPKDLKTSIAVSSKVKVGRSVLRLTEGKSAVEVYMGPTKDGYPQAILQEFGTIHHPPQAYMRPAWDSGKGKVLDDLKRELWSEVEKAAARAAKKAAKATKG